MLSKYHDRARRLFGDDCKATAKSPCQSIGDELQRHNHSKEPVAQGVAAILTVRCVPQGVTDLSGMQRLARLAERAKSLATRFARFGQHAVKIQTVLSNLKLPNPSMDLESIDSAISDLIKPRFFVFSPLCLRVSVVNLI